MDFRKKVMEVKQREGLSIRAVATRFGISFNTVMSWRKNITPKVVKRSPRRIDPKVLLQDVEKYPDSYLHERAKRLGVSGSGIHRTLKNLGVTYKKNSSSSQSRSREAYYLLPRAV
jgi:transposase